MTERESNIESKNEILYGKILRNTKWDIAFFLFFFQDLIIAIY